MTNPHSFPPLGRARLRRGRWNESGRIYLITFTTSAREPLFAEWGPATAAIRAFSTPSIWRRSRLLCWVLMPDHWHGLVQLGQTDNLSALIQRVKGGAARAANKARSRSGVAVWSSGFHDHALRADEDLRSVARYVVLNPVRAGLAVRVGEYPFWDAVWLPQEEHRG